MVTHLPLLTYYGGNLRMGCHIKSGIFENYDIKYWEWYAMIQGLRIIWIYFLFSKDFWSCQLLFIKEIQESIPVVLFPQTEREKFLGWKAQWAAIKNNCRPEVCVSVIGRSPRRVAAPVEREQHDAEHFHLIVESSSQCEKSFFVFVALFVFYNLLA